MKTSFNSIINKIIEFSIKSFIENEYAFRDNQYVRTMMNFIEKIINLKNCFDFDCPMICENRKMFHDKISNLIIKQLDKSIFVRDINNSMHNINEYVVIFCFMKEKLSDDSNHLSKFIMKMHLINDFKINTLIDTNVMKSQKMNLFFVDNILIIDVCKNLQISIDTIIKSNFNNRRTIQTRHVIIIFFHFTIEISIIYQNADKQHDLSNDRDYFFEFQCSKQIQLDENDNIFAHIMNAFMFKILARNITNQTIKLFRRCRLETIIDYEQANCYQLISNAEFFIFDN